MILNFVFLLLFEGIKFFYCVIGGWYFVGEVVIDDFELFDKMGMFCRIVFVFDL